MTRNDPIEPMPTPAKHTADPPRNKIPEYHIALPDQQFSRTGGPVWVHDPEHPESKLGEHIALGGWLSLTAPFNGPKIIRPAGDAYPRMLTTTTELDGFDTTEPAVGDTDTGTHPLSAADVRSVERLMEIARILDEKTRDPSTVHPDQRGLREFTGHTQADVNPDGGDVDPRLDHLPAFLDDDDVRVHSQNDPSLHAGLDVCDQCGATDPWEEPLERGMGRVRDGGPRDGNPDFNYVDPSTREMKRDPETGCPFCTSKSTRHRKTKTPAFVCNNCGLEFEHPVRRERDDDGERVRLFWRCGECGQSTRAPFRGVPEELIPDDW